MKKTLLVFTFCAFIDQIIKIVLFNNLEIGLVNPVIKGFFNITLVLNDGAAFSILKSKTLFLIIISLLVFVFLLLYVWKNKKLRNVEYITYGVLLGGIIGNLIDRIIYGSVIDYLDFNIFGYSFPIFNFADVCIVVAMFVILFFTFKEGKSGINS